MSQERNPQSFKGTFESNKMAHFSDYFSSTQAMEQWLDSNPDFALAYFSRKATRHMIEAWIANHPKSVTGLGMGLTHSHDSVPTALCLGAHAGSRSGSPNSRTSSGASTPARKISAQEFEKRGYLKPMVSTTQDGQFTFLGQSPQEEEDVAPATTLQTHDDITLLSHSELMEEFVKDICNDLDVDSLCFKILKNCCHLLHAHR